MAGVYGEEGSWPKRHEEDSDFSKTRSCRTQRKGQNIVASPALYFVFPRTFQMVMSPFRGAGSEWRGERGEEPPVMDACMYVCM